MTAARNVLIAGIGGASLGADHCVPSVLALCRRRAAAGIVPGGEAPTILLARAPGELAAAGIRLAASTASIFRRAARPDAHTGLSLERVQPRQHQKAHGGDPARGREEMA